MQKRNAKQKRNVRNLAAVTTLTAIILVVSTYAWFIGLDEVTVEDFTVKIAAIDSLELSLDGENWADTIAIDPETIENIYNGSTNSWTGRQVGVDEDGDGKDDFVGLIPMSSIGEMDGASSRMVLYEKAGLSATPPYGTSLMASRVNNYQDADDTTDGHQPGSEVDGYIAFDLFVKNYTGAQYIEGLNTADEEAIYLTDESSVAVTLTGANGGTTDAAEDAIRQASGIENSVRVAFAQVGRVVGTEDDETVITGITCNGTAGTVTAGVTGICRDASIWEPNDTAHVDGAINYYNNNCGYRGTGSAPTTGVTTKGCITVANGAFVPTYAVATDVSSDMDVNIYDGGYNGLEVPEVPATMPDGTTAYPNAGDDTLVAVDTFTDTEKLLNADERPSIMTLAPNSITKIRIYIYLEGQDIDNYDWAIDGKQITVDFGFSKQIYETP